MSVDIDIGGKRPDDFEDEDIISDEDFADVEEVEVVEEPEEPITPQKAPPSAVKKPSPWVKRILVIVVVIVLIIVALFAFVYFGTEVTRIHVNLDHDEPDDLEVSVLVSSSGMASIAGDADLEVTYDDNVIYTSKVSINDDGNGQHTIPYTSFVEENGNYYFQVKYKGKESPLAEYQEKSIVESLNITADVGRVQGNGQLNLTVFMLDKNGGMMGDTPKSARITFIEIKNIDTDDTITSNDPEQTVDASYFRKEYSNYDQGGNYFISVTVENSRVKSDSDYRTITETRDRMFLNILPIADAYYEVPNQTLFTYDVEFHADDSWNDGLITLYKWDLNEDGDFNDVGEQTTEPYTSSQYTKGYSPDVLLNIEGDIMIWDPIDQQYYPEMGSIEIKVNSP